MNESRFVLHGNGLLSESLARASHMLEADLDAALEEHGLSRAKLGALGALMMAGEPIALGQLAEQLTCVKSNITQLVDRLEADGLVKRLADDTDRRSKRAALTDEGRRRYEVGLKIKEDVENGIFKRLTADEQRVMAAALEKLNL